MIDVRHPASTPMPADPARASATEASLHAKLRLVRQLVEHDGITKSKTIIARFWAETESAIMQIFNVVAAMLDGMPDHNSTSFSPLTSLDEIAILSISNTFSHLTRAFVLTLFEHGNDSEQATSWRHASKNVNRWQGRSTQDRHAARSIATDVRRESNIMLEQLQALRDTVSQGSHAAQQRGERQHCTAQAIHQRLITHANNLVDALLAFFTSSTFAALEHQLGLAVQHLVTPSSNGPCHPSYRSSTVHGADNGSTTLAMLQDTVAGNGPSAAAHNQDDVGEDQDDGTAGTGPFRSISSFKSQPASTMTSVAPQSTATTSSTADKYLFDSANNTSHHYATPEEHMMRSSLPHVLHRSTPTNDSNIRESAPTPKGTSALKLLFGTRWGGGTVPHDTPTPKKSRSLRDMFYAQLTNTASMTHSSKQRKGSHDSSVGVSGYESVTAKPNADHRWPCSACNHQDDTGDSRSHQADHAGSFSGVKPSAGAYCSPSHRPTCVTCAADHHHHPASSLPSPPPSAKNMPKTHQHFPPRIPALKAKPPHEDPMSTSSSEDTLAVSASESSIRTQVEIDRASPLLLQPQDACKDSDPVTRVDSAPNSDQRLTQAQQQNGVPDQERGRLRRSPSTLSAIHTEHAQPTFISPQQQQQQQPYHSLAVPEDSNKAQHLAVPGLGNGSSNGRTLKHFRSESDLSRLKNMFTPASTSRRPACDRPPKQQQQLTSAPKLAHSGSTNTIATSYGIKAWVPQRTSSLRSSASTTTLSSTNDKDTGGGGDGLSWGLLRGLRKNHSSANLRQAAREEALRETLLECSSFNALGKNAPPSRDSTIYISENGQDVLVMETVGGKTEVVAGTQEKLFARLADEGFQDLDYVDTYILNHSKFTTSAELLENLMARFHMETLPDSQQYSKRCIQVKVLNVISRWVKLQYFDFKKLGILQTRLEAFLNGDVERAGFSTEAKMIRSALDLQIARHSRRRHSILALSSHSLASFGSTTSLAGPRGTISSTFAGSPPPTARRPSPTTSIFSFGHQHQGSTASITTPPTSPSSTMAATHRLAHDDSCSILLSTDAKHIARYLTLADFYLFKCITGYDYLSGPWRRRQPQKADPPHQQRHTASDECCYIDLMTRRANMLTHWIVHELLSIKGAKQRRTGLRRAIEIAKFCVEWNNYHTAMVISMGLVSTPIQKMQDTWESLPSRDTNAFLALQRLLDVSNNMSNYRQAFSKKVKKSAAPAVPFFPLVLKDLTFYMDGTPTMRQQQQQQQAELINFSKFRSVTKFVQGIISHTHENYWFAGELDHLAFFFPQQEAGAWAASSATTADAAAGPLDHIAEVIEYRLRAVADGYSDVYPCI